MDGEPKQILKPKDKYGFELDKKVLEEILLGDDIKNLPAVVISVAGTFRQGKSFLLSYFLRYLRAKGSDDWLGSEDSPLQGFGWAPGRKRVTRGIYMWSKPFVVELDDKTKVAVLLMDTQGTFDGKSTMKGSGTVFSLSALLSSVLIYNLMKNIDESDLDYLQIFIEYGSRALEDCESKPFQKLHFLVRDYPRCEKFGTEGGEELLEDILQIEDDQAPELQFVRRMIKSCFTDINCFTLPHPGQKVEMNGSEGKLSDMETDFREYLSQFVPLILSPKNLIIKNISGNKVTVGEIYRYLENYFNAFSGDKIPPPQTMLMNIIATDNMVARQYAMEHYDRAMGKLLQILSNDPSSKMATLDEEHTLRKKEALNLFKRKKKRGGAEGEVAFYEHFDKELDIKVHHYKETLCCQQKLRDFANTFKNTYKEDMKKFFKAESNIQDELEKAHQDFLEFVEEQFSVEYLELDPAGAMSEEFKEFVGEMTEDYKGNFIKELTQLFTQLCDQIKNKVQLKVSIDEIEQIYTANMKQNCGSMVFFQNSDIFNSHHLKAKTEAMESFYCKSAIYNDIELQTECKTDLENKISSIYNMYVELNKEKQEKERKIEEICSNMNIRIKEQKSSKFDFKKYLEIASHEWNEYKTSKETQIHGIYEEKLKKDIEKICKCHQDNIICSCARGVAKANYKIELSKICGPSMEKAELDEVFVAHMYAKREVLDQYEITTMSTEESIADEQKRKLEEDLRNVFEFYKDMNEGRLLMSRPEWNKPHVLKWKKEAMKFQQKCYDFHTECRQESHNSSDDSILKRQIRIAFSGRLPGSNENKRLSDEENDLFEKVMKKNYGMNYETNFIFVSILIKKGESEGESENRGLIHVKKPRSIQEEFYEYFDCNGSAYLDWKNYLENNDLPECYMCFPKNGIYTDMEGKIVAGFDLSRACRLSEKTSSMLGTILSLVATLASIYFGIRRY